MKATNSSTYRSLMQFMNRTTNRLQDLQIQTATGKKLNRASDNPSGVGPVVKARSDISASDLFIKNNEGVLDRLKSQDTVLGQADNLMQRAVEVAVTAGNGTYGAYENNTLADEIANIKSQMFALGNSQMDGKYFYSGFEETTPPFMNNPAYDPVLDPRPVLYNGDFGAVDLEVAPDQRVTINYTGSEIFLGDGDGDGAADAGRVDVFSVLTTLEEALRANDQAGATAELDNLYAAQEQIVQYQGKTGVLANRVEQSRDYMADVKVDLEAILSRYQDVDMLEAITQMTQQEQTLQAAMSVTGKISQLSILDYL